MPLGPMHYLPLSAPFFAILVAVLAVVWVMLEVGALSYAYMRIGLSPRGTMLVLLASLIGSYFNIPVADLPQRQIVSGQLIEFFGMQYVVPMVSSWPGTVIAVNVGGAVIPVLVSLYLCARRGLWIQAAIAVLCVAALSHWLAHPVAGLGIAVPIFVPALVTAVVALILSRWNAPALAYVAGSCGTLIGADLLNLDRLQGLGAPVASIGGAGTFDGIFLTGVVAVLIAGMTSPAPRH
ncbi:MAG TPA: DUF1614 domain-containing protein [Acetobacteraceae bacterium]|jgi:uncharacterized membrane protein|nr:DUF1614 domain-containing protein [Acetobacteraceae bacterium]